MADEINPENFEDSTDINMEEQAAPADEPSADEAMPADEPVEEKPVDEPIKKGSVAQPRKKASGKPAKKAARPIKRKQTRNAVKAVKKEEKKIETKKVEPVLEKKEKKPGVLRINKTIIWGIITALIIFGIVLLVWQLIKNPIATTGGGNVDVKPAAGAAKVDFYVMSQCPYGTQVEDAMAPVIEQLGNSVEFNLNFIAQDNGDGTFTSLHGENEVKGNIVQLCALKYDKAAAIKMIVCMNKNAQGIPGNWEECAKTTTLDVNKIKVCYEGSEGKELLSASIKKSQAVNAQGSPTIYINNQLYQGARKSTDFLRASCNALQTKPTACSSIPEPTKISTIIINDKRCAECDATSLKTQLKTLFPGITYKEYDYSDAEGKKLYQDLKLTALPAVLFDESITKDESYASVQNYLQAAGQYQSLRIGATFDPTAEICDNKIDDTGDGKIDCEDATCKDSLTCRPELLKNVQVFIMSDCPYGKKAIEALKPVVDNFGAKITWDVHYIASASGDGFQSLHGQYEVDEDIVQLCVKKYSADKWLDYLYCRSTKGIKGIDWKECATSSGVAVESVQKCFDGTEGKELLREDIKIAEALGIGASPTWLANNRYQFSGIDAETVKTNLCKYNTGLQGCENVIATDTTTPPAASCG